MSAHDLHLFGLVSSVVDLADQLSEVELAMAQAVLRATDEGVSSATLCDALGWSHAQFLDYARAVQRAASTGILNP